MVKIMAKKKKIQIGSKEYPYCGNRKCQDFECIRHISYTPWYELIWRENYKPDKNGNCKNKIT